MGLISADIPGFNVYEGFVSNVSCPAIHFVLPSIEYHEPASTTQVTTWTAYLVVDKTNLEQATLDLFEYLKLSNVPNKIEAAIPNCVVERCEQPDIYTYGGSEYLASELTITITEKG